MALVVMGFSPTVALASTGPSQTIAGAQQLTVGSGGGVESGGSHNIDFWLVQLNGGDRLVLDLTASASGQEDMYHVELYAPGTTDATFSGAPPVDEAGTGGVTPDQVTVQAPFTGRFVLAVCENNATTSFSDCRSADPPGGAPTPINIDNPMNPYTFTTTFVLDPTSTSVVCSPSAVAVGNVTSCAATVSDTASSGGSTPTGTVGFAASPTTGAFGNAGSCALVPTGITGIGTCSVAFTPSTVGDYTITASYHGDSGHGANSGPSSTVTVAAASTSTALVSSANSVRTGRTVTYTATVSPVPDGGAVAFTDGGARISGCGAVSVSRSTGTATCQTTYTTTGSRTIVASYFGDRNFAASQSATLDQQVTRSTVVAAVPSRTKITKAKISPRKHTASFRFTAHGASNFQCELIRAAKKGHREPKVKFSPCKSPQAYDHLKAGAYTFLVRGVNRSGADPDSARRAFKID